MSLQRLQKRLQQEDESDDSVALVFSRFIPKMQKPVMSESVEADVLNAISMFQNGNLWKEWGMDTLREQGPAVLLKGPPGTGKTTIAKWMAAKVRRGFKKLSVADIGGGDPGATERAVVEFFADARKRKNMTVFIDECDHLLGKRDRIEGAGLTWMLGTTETLMMQMNEYSGLLICASNHPEIMDPALTDRFMSIISVDNPDKAGRLKLWRMKLPEEFPLQFDEDQLDRISKFTLNGRQIETVIMNVASNAIRQKIKPTFKMFLDYCEREKAKHL